MTNNIELCKTHLSPRDYEANEVCRIVNPTQVALYLKHGVYPIDIYHSFDNKGKTIIVNIFLKEDTKELYQKWVNHELK